ncbi:cytochrome P450 [Nocardia sp. CA-135398]|uniref:cytochrome P450 n=1 Tax=Nocardia sp. CA-135398 TaxID=3239977 RepID=UPI003D99A619
MTESVAVYPFPAVPPDRAVELIQQVIADRPMSKMTMPFGGDVWVIHRYHAAKQVLENPVFVRGPFARNEREIPYFVQFPDFLKQTFQFADPPDHTRLRKLVAKGFTARRVNKLREGTLLIAEDLLDKMTAKGASANLHEDFSLPLPIQVISELLGVPLSDRDKFVAWSKSTLATSGMTEEEVLQAGAELYMYLAELIAARRAEPHDDLLSVLAAAEDADETLTDAEILPIAMLLIVGGFDNTANFINTAVLALLRNPDQLKQLLADIDAVVGTTVEEVLRHGTFAVGQPVAGGNGLPPWIASEDVELDGQVVKKGEAVLIDPGCANHDPAMFADAGTFDVTRKSNLHLTFSHGLHHCIGAPLARMEMQVALSSLFRRFPALQLAGEPEYATEYLTAGMKLLPVTW